MRIYFAGGGQCTEYIAKRLIREGHDLVLLEQDQERSQYLNEKLDARIIRGNASSIKDWQRAGLEQADMFMACTHDDETNVLSSLIANDMAPAALKAIRLRTPEYNSWLKTFERLGLRVDRVVHPESDMVSRILKVIATPGVADIRNFANDRIKLFSMNLKADNPIVGTQVGDFHLIAGENTGRIGVVLRSGKAIIPHHQEQLLAGDHVYIVTSTDNLDITLQHMGIKKQNQIHQVFIVGGGEVGLELARALEQEKINIKLFEKNSKRCEFLAEELPGTVIINADGTSQDVLLQSNIEGIDAFISLTDNEDANIISCLLARRLSVEKVIPMVTSINYIELAQRLGINTTVNPRIKAADALLEFIRKGGVHSVRTLGEDQVEVIELEVGTDSAYINQPLQDIELPEGSMIGAIARPDDSVIIPHGDSEIQANDILIIFTCIDAISSLEKKILSTTH